MENPINLLYIFAILVPFILTPVAFFVRKRNPELSNIIYFFAIQFFVVLAFVFVSGPNQSIETLRFFFAGPGLIYWLATIAGQIFTWLNCDNLGIGREEAPTILISTVATLVFSMIFLFAFWIGISAVNTIQYLLVH